MADLTAERAAELRKRIETLYPLVRDSIERADALLASAPMLDGRRAQCEMTFVLEPEIVHAVSIALCIAVGMTTEGEDARDELFSRGYRLLEGAK
jgi:hypothetical protein